MLSAERLGWVAMAVFLSLAWIESRGDENPPVLVDVNLFASAVPSQNRSILVGDRENAAALRRIEGRGRANPG